MPSAHLVLQAQKSQAYFESLCKHFARKVEVKQENDKATVAFPMGLCTMLVEDTAMHFEASADDNEALDAVKHIIASHAVRFGELKNASIEWCPTSLDSEANDTVN